MRYCKECGAENPDNATFCSLCHRPFHVEAEDKASGTYGAIGDSELNSVNMPNNATVYWDQTKSPPGDTLRDANRGRGGKRVAIWLVVAIVILGLIGGGLYWGLSALVFAPNTYTTESSGLTFKYPRGWKELTDKELLSITGDLESIPESMELDQDKEQRVSTDGFVDARDESGKYFLEIISGTRASVPSPESPSPEDFLEELRRELAIDTDPGAGDIEPRIIEVGGDRALESGWDTIHESREETMRMLFVIHGDSSCGITFLSMDSRDEALGVYQGIVDSIEFKD